MARARAGVARRVRARLQAVADARGCARAAAAQSSRAAPAHRAHHAQHETKRAPGARTRRFPHTLHYHACG